MYAMLMELSSSGASLLVTTWALSADFFVVGFELPFTVVLICLPIVLAFLLFGLGCFGMVEQGWRRRQKNRSTGLRGRSGKGKISKRLYKRLIYLLHFFLVLQNRMRKGSAITRTESNQNHAADSSFDSRGDGRIGIRFTILPIRIGRHIGIGICLKINSESSTLRTP